MLRPQEDVMEAFYRRHDFSEVTILDPFMGGGTTVGEALRLNCKVVACDLNPVAWFLVRQAMRDVDGAALMAAYTEVEGAVAEKIGSMYATTCSGLRLACSRSVRRLGQAGAVFSLRLVGRHPSLSGGNGGYGDEGRGPCGLPGLRASVAGAKRARGSHVPPMRLDVHPGSATNATDALQVFVRDRGTDPQRRP